MRVDALTTWPWRRCCCTLTLTYGPTFPFVQFKPPEARERIRAGLSEEQAINTTKRLRLGLLASFIAVAAASTSAARTATAETQHPVHHG